MGIIQNMIFNKTQNIKEGAYLDYFKYFSASVLETTNKLQSTFQQEFTDDLLLDSQHMFKSIKKLLNAYEVLILEIKDSCEFVEIPSFGMCLAKIYFQLMSLIKFLIKGILKKGSHERVQRQKRPEQRFTMIASSYGSPQNVQDLLERQSIRTRENAAHIFKDLSQQVNALEKQHSNNIKESENTLEKISQGREKLETIESSKSENVLNQAVTLLFRKGQHINNFLNLLQSGQITKEQPEAFCKIKEKIDEDNLKRIYIARNKLNQLFANHVIDHENKKKAAMVSKEMQVSPEDLEGDEMLKKRKSAYRKTHIDQVKKLRQELQILQDENIALREYIEKKMQEHQSKTSQMMAEKMQLQSKLAAEKDNRSSSAKSKVSLEAKKSLQQLDLCGSEFNFDENAQINQTNLSIGPDNSDYPLQINRQLKVKIPKTTKAKVKFQSPSHNLAISSKINEWTYFSQPTKIQQPPAESIHEVKMDRPVLKSQESFNYQDLLNVESPDERQIILLKIGNPLAKLNSQSDSYNQKENNFGMRKETSNIRIKQAQPRNISFQYSSYNKNKHKSIKKQSIIAFAQDTLPKRASDFSQASCIKDSKDSNFKVGEKEAQKSQKDYKKTYRFYQKDSNISSQEQKELLQQAQFASNFTAIGFRPSKSALSFVQADLPMIFASEQNAKNYEFLNLSLASKQKKYISALEGKTLVKSLKASKPKGQTQSPCPEAASTGLEDPSSFLTSVFFELLGLLRRDKLNYRALCNFLRYPFSSVYLSSTKAWKEYQSQQESLDYLELRKLLTRLVRLHSECNQCLCLHLRYFLQKVGLEFH